MISVDIKKSNEVTLMGSDLGDLLEEYTRVSHTVSYVLKDIYGMTNKHAAEVLKHCTQVGAEVPEEDFDVSGYVMKGGTRCR